MKVYRIVHKKWASTLKPSGAPARWNSKGVNVIYTSGSQALSCLENVVHRSGEGLNKFFKLLIIEIPDKIQFERVFLSKLITNWSDYTNFPYTQIIGDKWINGNSTVVLRVPSAIIPEEYNYILNPAHSDFEKISILSIDDFVFDSRIKK